MQNELITVVMPVYNAERFLNDAIESVLRQTYNNLEVILVEDCSKDNSLAVAKQYEKQDNRVRVLSNVQNSGVAVSRNEGIKAAKGMYIAFLDSDDVWVEDKLEKQFELMKRKNAQISYCSYDFIDEFGQEILKPFLVPESTNFNQMLYANDIGCSTVLVRSELIKKHLFSTEFYHEDYALWMEILQDNVTAAGVSEVCVHYRKVIGSRSDNKINAAKHRWIIFRKKLHLPLWKCMGAFVQYMLNGIRKHYLANYSRG